MRLCTNCIDCPICSGCPRQLRICPKPLLRKQANRRHKNILTASRGTRKGTSQQPALGDAVCCQHETTCGRVADDLRRNSKTRSGLKGKSRKALRPRHTEHSLWLSARDDQRSPRRNYSVRCHRFCYRTDFILHEPTTHRRTQFHLHHRGERPTAIRLGAQGPVVPGEYCGAPAAREQAQGRHRWPLPPRNRRA
jgi:hypothetical protein